MPPGEELAALGQSGATLAIHLSINNLGRVVRELTPCYGPDCPVVVAYRVSWPDERIPRGTLADLRAQVKAERLTRTAHLPVGPTLAPAAGAPPPRDRRRHAPDHPN